MRTASRWLGWLLLLLGAFSLRATHLDWGLPEVLEEATPLRESVAFWGEPGGRIDLNPEFFKYPSLSFYLHFLLQGAVFLVRSASGTVGSLNEFRELLIEDFPRAALAARWLSAALGALVVVPTFLLGKRLAGDAAGWVAALVIAVLPVAVGESRLVSPDTPLVLFAACALAASTRLAERGERSDYLWTGLWIGLAAATKYPGALLLVSFAAAHLVANARTGNGPMGTVASSFFWQGLFASALVFAAASPYVLLDWKTAAADIAFERRHMAVGHLGREGGRAWSFYFGHAIPSGWTLPVALSSLAGAVVLCVRAPSRRAWLPGAVFAALLLLVMGSWKMAAPRYVLPLAPLAAAWAGSAVAAVRLRGRDARIPSAALGALLLLWPLVVSIRETGFRGREDSRNAAEAWILAHVPERSTILVERYGPELDPERYTVLSLPFHGITPHVYDPAYSPVLYGTFDYVVLSSGVGSRYLAAPREYPAQVAFYEAFDRSYEEVTSFTSSEFVGPEIRILRRDPERALKDLTQIPESFFAGLHGNTLIAEHFSALGIVLDASGRSDLGGFLLQRAVNMDPESAKTWGNLGTYHVRAGRFEDALFAFRRAKELDPEDPKIAFNLATMHARNGEATQAADAYREAIARDPSMQDAYIGLARVLVQEDRYRAARGVLEQFLELFPRSPKRTQAEKALLELDKMGPGRP